MDSIELENVRPSLLLPPTEKGGIASELAGGIFDLGDRVACLTSTGGPPPLWQEHLMCFHLFANMNMFLLYQGLVGYQAAPDLNSLH